MSTNSNMSPFQVGPDHQNCNCHLKPATLNRRAFLRLGGLAGVTMLAAGSLAACGNVADVAPAAADENPVEADSGEYKLSIEKAGSGNPNPGPTVSGGTPQLNPYMFQAPNLTTWLNQNPNIRDAVVWQDGTTVLNYTQWSQTLKTRLQNIFEAIWTSNPVIEKPAVIGGIPNGRYSYTPPVNIMNYKSPDIAATVLTKADTLTNYLNYLAYSFRNELAKEVKWSMKSYSAAQLANLLDSRTLYTWVTGPGPTFGYELPAGYSGGYQVSWTNLPTHPLISLQFLQQNNLIGQTAQETIGRLIYWSGQNLSHFGTTQNTQNDSPGELNYNFWHYRGAPPISRMIEGTKPDDPIMSFSHWTWGCWGTVSFLKMVLQVINIPVDQIKMGHCLPHFMTIGRYLSHGDDPYSGRLLNKHPELSGEIYLINQADFDSHFGPGVSDINKGNNVGYKAVELLAKYP